MTKKRRSQPGTGVLPVHETGVSDAEGGAPVSRAEDDLAESGMPESPDRGAHFAEGTDGAMSDPLAPVASPETTEPAVCCAKGCRPRAGDETAEWPDETAEVEPPQGSTDGREDIEPEDEGLDPTLESVAEDGVEPDDEGLEPTVESVVEAVLFASDEPLTDARLANIVETTSKQVRRTVDDLNEKYRGSGNAFRIEQVAGGYQMLTLPPFNHWLRKLLRVRSDNKLSPAALETLAIIAYKQPIIRADIEAIRGVAVGEVIRSLMYKGLVKIVGRAEILGRPMLYGTTKKFLEVFGLNTLKDLPKIEELKKPRDDVEPAEQEKGETMEQQIVDVAAALALAEPEAACDEIMAQEAVEPSDGPVTGVALAGDEDEDWDDSSDDDEGVEEEWDDEDDEDEDDDDVDAVHSDDHEVIAWDDSDEDDDGDEDDDWDDEEEEEEDDDDDDGELEDDEDFDEDDDPDEL